MKYWLGHFITYEVRTDVWEKHISEFHHMNSTDGTCSMSALYQAITGRLFANSSWRNPKERQQFMAFLDALEFKDAKKQTTYKAFFDAVNAHAENCNRRVYTKLAMPFELWPTTDIFSHIVLPPDFKLIVWEAIEGTKDFHPIGMFGFGALSQFSSFLTSKHLPYLQFDGDDTKQFLLTGNHFSVLQTSFFNDPGYWFQRQPINRSRRSSSSSSSSSSLSSSSSSDADLRLKFQEAIEKLYVIVEELLLERFFYYNHCGFYVSFVASCHQCLC